MYLKSIEINGFKSFAEKVSIDFKEGITSIVGPNGSGKSNVLDAILWALGEQSHKNIRAKDGIDVIFSGGKNYKPKNMAEVSLNIDNSKKILYLDFSEIKISRRIYRSGENEYYINGKKVRLKDINDLFMDTGIGKSAYSVIGQGKVEQIVMATPQELKNIIEEAAGIKKIKKKKEESQLNLKEVEDNIEKIEYIEEDVKTNLLPLQEKAEKAKKYKELYYKKNFLKKSLLKKYCFTRKNQLEGLDYKINEQKNIIENIEQLFKDESEELERINNERKKLSEIIEIKEEEYIAVKTNSDELNNEKILYNERKSNFIREKNEKKEMLSEYNSKLSETNSLYLRLKEEERQISENFYKEKMKIENFKKEEENYLKKIEVIENTIKDYKNEIMEFEIKKIKFFSDIEQNKKNEKIISTKINELKNEYKEYHKELEEKKNYIYQLNEEINIKNYQKTEKEKLIKTLNSEIINYSQKLKEIEVLKKDFEYKIQNREMKFENILNLEKNHEGFFKGVKEVLNSNISGVVGAFVSLVDIPAQYETAIQSATGNSLQDIVVEHSDIAKKCIGYLKTKNLGRASFLPLDTIKEISIKKIPNIEGVLGLASQLVNYDKKYNKIINFVLGNILIVETIDIGISIVKSNLFSGNIVSLDGEIISGSGKITGGEKVKSSIAVIFDRQREKKLISEELETIKNDYKILLNDFNNIQSKLFDKENILNENKTFFDNLENDLNNFNMNIKNETENLKTYQKKYDLINHEIKNEQENLNFTNNNIENFENKTKFYEKEIFEKNKKLKEISEELENFKILSGENNKNYSNQMILLAKHESQFMSLKEKIENFEKDIKEIDIKKNSLIDKIGKIDKEVDIITKQLLQIDEHLEDIKRKTNIYYNDIKSLKNKYKVYEDNEKDKIIQVKDIENKIIIEKNSYSKKIKEQERISIELENFEKELSEINISEEVEMITNEEEVKREINILEKNLSDMGEVNLFAIEEYDALNEKYKFISNQKKDLIDSKKSLNDLIKTIEKEIEEKFITAYTSIRNNFSYMCTEVLNNSKGDIIILDENNILDTGLELVVKFQNKKTQTLSLLSGGEKSMVAVAFIMAVFMYKPSPFTFFDEIEAALDETNTQKLIKMLKRFTDESQFILITHNKETMKESDMLYGVTMNKEIGVSKLISVEM